MTAPVKVRNPRYAGATPPRRRPRPPAASTGRRALRKEDIRGDEVPVEKPSTDEGRGNGRHLRDGV